MSRPVLVELTEREHAVLAGLASGRYLKDIAGGLGLNYETAKTTLRRARLRLGARTTEVAIWKWARMHAERRCWLCEGRRTLSPSRTRSVPRGGQVTARS